MSFEFRPCTLEMDYEAYIQFLLRHHNELNLPYSFAMKLGFIGSPLIFGKAMLVFSEEPYEIVGVVGFVYGTGVNSYEDRHICQVEVAFIQKAYQRTSLFIQGLKALVDLIKADNPNVTQVQFWTPGRDGYLDRLFARFNTLPGSSRTIVNTLALHKVAFMELESYCHRCMAAWRE
ncbi:hypothetical protein [Paenibacillus eucommiae]|uniref:N-acetyltransferase domain-containing protein n=1 Tax=Paenibacillus eucommiae TaxID=1355755 RepID=A0ABS4ISH5_9BACL|nr:hypothetical protein [Paenibacillus eucommiae]MBP1990529.1 hypothetical protein [Paenibacillus eucommiae]